jgi:phospholipase C
MPRDTITLSLAQQQAIPIRHIVVMVKENRSYDHLLGSLAVRGQPESEAIPATYTSQGMKPQVAPITCFSADPPHSWADQHAQVNGGKMDGFGSVALYYYEGSEFPFYYWLANTFALADRYFSSALAGSVATRAFGLFGSSAGLIRNDDPLPPTTTPSIMAALDQKGVTWGAYTDYGAFYETLGSNWPGVAAHSHSRAEFLAAARDGTLPSVAWIDSKPDVEDDQPPSDIQVGEAWTRETYEALIEGPSWPSTVLLWTYDEGGGYFDHVPPPAACVPADGTPNQESFDQLGMRVPMAVISPWARRHYVSHVVHSHTSILRFIETVFDLPALTARDANSDALLDMFDFSCTRQAPIPPAPPSGTGGCP